ncbi:unnamed protein product [Zymoseptoria tritici ST99CH_1A5]|uniref:Uncharacterized protein n=1 Tax=Zymoseptoria tritici ST99CH_1A5 TaxID=1276529 RepID=A0A1Y6LN33_ZYMTR|nr:unnamed protein product [Zymoseptoria tritici ST99CH_1A5]
MDPPDPPPKSDWDAEMAVGGKPLVILKKHTAAANSMLKAYKDVKMAHIEAIAPTATAPNEVEKQTMSFDDSGNMTAPTEPLAMRTWKRTKLSHPAADVSSVPNVPTGPKAMRRRSAAAQKMSQGRKAEDGHLASRTAERKEMAGSNYEDRVRLYKGSQKLMALQEAAESAKIEASAQGDARGEDDARTVEESDDLMTDSDPENRGMTGAS